MSTALVTYWETPQSFTWQMCAVRLAFIRLERAQRAYNEFQRIRLDFYGEIPTKPFYGKSVVELLKTAKG